MIPNEQVRHRTNSGNLISTKPILERAGPATRDALARTLRSSGLITVAKEVESCSRWSMGRQDIAVTGPDGARRITGLNHCKRMLCPICAPYLMGHRVHLMHSLAAQIAQQEGLQHFFFTLSVQHHQGTPWKTMVTSLGAMVTSLRGGKRWKERVKGFARVLESTHGPMGHHPHLHVLVSVKASGTWDSAPFMEWVKKSCERSASRSGMACDFSKGWWHGVAPGDLMRTVSYFGLNEKWGQASLLHGGATTSFGKHHTPIWSLPTAAFAEIWTESKGTRWFSTGGCWKAVGLGEEDSIHPTARGQKERENSQEVVHDNVPFLHFPYPAFRAWAPRERRERIGIIYNPSVPRSELISMALAWGGRLGPPPQGLEGREDNIRGKSLRHDPTKSDLFRQIRHQRRP